MTATNERPIASHCTNPDPSTTGQGWNSPQPDRGTRRTDTPIRSRWEPGPARIRRRPGPAGRAEASVAVHPPASRPYGFSTPGW